MIGRSASLVSPDRKAGGVLRSPGLGAGFVKRTFLSARPSHLRLRRCSGQLCFVSLPSIALSFQAPPCAF